MSFLCVVAGHLSPSVCKRAVWTVGYGERACWGLETTKGDIRRLEDAMHWSSTSKVVWVPWMGDIGLAQIRQCNS